MLSLSLRFSLVCLLLPLLPLGLAWAANFPDYPVRQVGDYKVSATESGVVVAAEPVDDLKEQKKYFSTELTRKGFVAVFVVMKNQSATDSFLIRKTGITYGPDESGVATPDARSKAGERLAIGSLAALSIGGSLIAAKMISNASQVQQNILKKELQSKTLSPGATAYGFVYVPVPTKAARERLRLRIPITRVGTDETLTLDLVF